MAPEEMAGPRYRGFGMSRWARTVTLEGNKKKVVWEEMETYVSVQFDSPQRNVSLNLNDVQRVKVGDEQVGLSVGCSREKPDQIVDGMQNAAGRCFRAYLPKDSGRRLHLMSSVRLRLPYASTNTPNSATGTTLVNAA